MEKACKFGLILLVILAVSKPFSPWDLTMSIFGVTLVVLLTSLRLQGEGFRKITLVFLAVGVSALLYSDASFAVWAQSLTSMSNVIVIIVIIDRKINRCARRPMFWRLQFQLFLVLCKIAEQVRQMCSHVSFGFVLVLRRAFGGAERQHRQTARVPLC